MPPATSRLPRPTHLELVPSPEEAPPRLVAVPPIADGTDGANSFDGASSLDGRIPEPPTSLIGALAVRSFEVLDGIRAVASLGANVTIELSRQLAQVRAIRMERNLLYRDERRAIPHLGRMILCRPLPTVAEASVVVHTPTRSHAVAIRLEWGHGRWRATELTVL